MRKKPIVVIVIAILCGGLWWGYSIAQEGTEPTTKQKPEEPTVNEQRWREWDRAEETPDPQPPEVDYEKEPEPPKPTPGLTPGLAEVEKLILETSPLPRCARNQQFVPGKTVLEHGENEYLIRKNILVHEQGPLDEILTLMDVDHLWVGNLVGGKSIIEKGDLASLPVPRAQTKITARYIVPKSGEVVNLSRVLSTPNVSEYEKQHVSLLQDLARNGANMAADYKYTVEEAHSREHMLFSLGLSASYAGLWNAKLNANYQTDVEQTAVFCMIRQSYYTIIADTKDSPVKWFPETITKNQLKSIGPGNPPCYVSSITYGRVIVLAVESQSNVKQVKAALNAGLNYGFFSGEVKGNLDYQKVLESSKVTLLVRGGPTDAAPTQISGLKAFSQLDSLIKEGKNFSLQNIGKPIAFTVRHLRDNSIASLESITDHRITQTRTSPYQYEVIVDKVKINDDLDGFGRGDGDFELFVATNEQGKDHRHWRGNLGTGDHGVSHSMGLLQPPGKTSKLWVRFGEEDSGDERSWDGIQRGDGYAQKIVDIDVAAQGGKDRPVSLPFPGDDGGNNVNLIIRMKPPALK